MCGLPIDAACHLLVLDDLCAPHVFTNDHPAFGGLCSGCGHREEHHLHIKCRACKDDGSRCVYCDTQKDTDTPLGSLDNMRHG